MASRRGHQAQAEVINDWTALCQAIQGGNQDRVHVLLAKAASGYGNTKHELLQKTLEGVLRKVKKKRKLEESEASTPAPKKQKFGEIAFSAKQALPANLMNLVLSMLNTKELAGCSRVGKSWHAASNNPGAWAGRQIGPNIFNRENTYEKPTATRALAVLQQTRYRGLRHLRLGQIKLGATTIFKLAQALPCLLQLDLSSSKGVKAHVYEQIATNMPALTSLDISDSFHDPNLASLTRLAHLQTLNVNSMINIAGCMRHIPGMRALTTLSMGAGFWSNYDDMGGTMRAYHLSSWTRLSIPSLTHLNLSKRWNINNDMLWTVLEACPNLHSLDLEEWTQLSGPGLRRISESAAASALRKLNLRGCFQQHRLQQGTGAGRRFIQRGPCTASHADLQHLQTACPLLDIEGLAETLMMIP